VAQDGVHGVPPGFVRGLHAGQARVRLHVVAREHDAVLDRVAVEAPGALLELSRPRDEEGRGVRVAGARADEVLIEVVVEGLGERPRRRAPHEPPAPHGARLPAGRARLETALDLIPNLERDLGFAADPGALAAVSSGVPRADAHGAHPAVAVLPGHLVLPEARLRHARELTGRIRVVDVPVLPVDVFGEVVLNAREVSESALGPWACEVCFGGRLGAEPARAIE